jgi:hypothetical protein
MALTKKQAAAIIRCVEADPECVRLINSWLRKVLPDRWGVAGGLRNLGYIASFQDPTDPKVAEMVCVGIAKATAMRIYRYRGKALEGVRGTRLADRKHLGVDHTATLVEMTDNTAYVFDWHATLNASNPLIGKPADWQVDDNCVDFDHFEGFT